MQPYLVPIVEPEVELIGNHSAERCLKVTEWLLKETFYTLYQHRVQLDGLLLKANMVVSGEDNTNQADISTVANMTLDVLNNTVPPGVAGVVFLSGGQTDINATAHLNAMNAKQDGPWALTFSYARALQRKPLEVWLGDNSNKEQAQAALLHRANMNALAASGQWSAELEALGNAYS